MYGDDRERNELARQLYEWLQELLDARQRVKAARAHLERFQRDSSLEAPPGFDINSLADFTMKRKRYEDEEQRRADSLARAERDFRGQEKRVLALLPEGVPLVYEYGTYGTNTPHGDYEIRKVSSGDAFSLEIREAQDKE